MALILGTRLGVYEVSAPIGEGGMGQVFRARDTKLNRDVALKVLPDFLAGDTERLARFTREAQTLASLNHPHIAQIYGLEESGGVRALVMELVEGEDLAQRVASGAIPLDEVLPLAKQIAEALEAAHEQGIIHRDLKPANIKVRPDGTVKVLDFGLAKAMEPSGAILASASMSPTITTPAMTQAGVILGTAAYMSPEQAKGRAADRRSDVWAFGVVLYEMLTGQRAFKGEDVSDTLAFILTREPDWTTLPAGTPLPIRRLLRRCLEKDRKRRLADAADARLEIEEALTAPAAPEGAATPSPTVPGSLWKRAIPVVTAAVVTSAIVGAAVWTLKPAPPLAITRFAFTLGENQQLSVGNQAVAMSPDGRLLVYVANDQLYLRSMSDLEARPIPGTRQTPTPYNPVFSPDGQFIAFYSQVDRTIKKIAVSGGAAVRIGPAPIELLGMTWDAGGIVFIGGLRESGNPVRIMRVSANGGQPEVLVKAKDLGEVMYGPQVLPGGEWVLFSSTTVFGNPDSWQVVVQSLKTGERKTLVTGGRDGRYLPTGHLVYSAGGVVFAVPFDVRHLAVTGGQAPVVEGVMRTSVIGAAQFSVSSTGSLAYMPGPMYGSSAQLDLALIDRKGGLTPLKLPPGAYAFPRVSPDGKQVAFGTDDGKEAIIWIYDLSGKSAMRRLTFGGRNRFPLWSSNGERVAFQSDREGDLGIFWQRADGSGTADRLTKPDPGTSHVPESWSPKGERFLFGAHKGSDISDPFGLNKGNVATDPFSLWTFSLQDKKATPFGRVQSFFPINSVFSPDGRWVAYTSGDEKGVIDIYVQPFPATGAKYQISKDPRSHHPLWSPDGKELYYIPGPVRSPLAVSVTTQPSFDIGNAEPVLFPGTAGPAVVRNYDIARDGRAIGVVPAGQTTLSGALAAQQIQVVLNWTEELKRLVPTR